MAEYIVREAEYPLATKQEVVCELVRCRDCKWYDITHPFGTINPDAHHCKANDRFYDGNHFCAYGERRTDEQT